MKLPIALLAPHFKISALPAKEHAAAYTAQSGLHDLGGYIEDYSAAISLFDFSLAQYGPPQSERWALIAGWDGAMTIYHFGTALEGIRSSLTMCPTIRSAMDYDVFRRALSDFRAKFPGYEKTRHAVAHAADKMKTPSKLAKHSYSGPHRAGGFNISNSTELTLTDSFSGRVFVSTWEGEIVTHELSKATLNNLMTVAQAVWRAFPPASAAPAAQRP